ncbi:hypothetical protein M758_6G114800 [Ceratodon purpureus]|nr:hypothetical protein M758_6G114800 [Ceratodon purpureus]
MEGSTPREGRAAQYNGWYWSRHRLSELGPQVLVRLTEEISNLPVFFSSDRYGGQVQRWKMHETTTTFLNRLVHDIHDLTDAGFSGQPDPDQLEELDVVERCVWALILLQGEVIPGYRHRCLMCNKAPAEELFQKIFCIPASVGVRLKDTHSTCGYWTMMELSLTPCHRDCDAPKLCPSHDFMFTSALNAVFRVVPRHDIDSET